MKHFVLPKAHRFAAATAALLTASLAGASLQAQAAERTVFVSVLDRANAPVTTLGPSDFIVREDGVTREVLRSRPATEPIDVAVLVDNSAAAEDAAQRIRDALRPFAAALQPGHAVALIGLADRPTVLADYTTDRQAFGRGVDRVFPQSGSGMTLLDALVDASRGLEKRGGARRAIVAVLTEGPEFSNLHYQQVLEALGTAGAAFYPIVIGAGGPPEDEPGRNRALVLDEGARASGGLRQTILSPMAVDTALRMVAAVLDNQYAVVYSRPESLIPPKSVTVAVKRQGLTARSTPAPEVRR